MDFQLSEQQKKPVAHARAFTLAGGSAKMQRLGVAARILGRPPAIFLTIILTDVKLVQLE